MEELVRELNDPSNQSAPERINEIQRQIQRLQREKAAWQLGLDLLQSEEANLRFYGALTLTIKINADWDHDDLGKDEAMRNYLLEALVSNYIRLVILPDSNFVLRKLCSTLAALFVRQDSGWSYPLRQVLACLLSGRYVSERDVPEMQILLEHAKVCSDQQLKGVLMIAAIVAEDLGNHPQTSLDESKLLFRLSANCPDAWHLFRLCVARFSEQQNTRQGQPDELFQLIVQAIPYWASLLKHQDPAEGESKTQSVARGCIASASNWLEEDSCTGLVLQMLISLQQSTPKLLRDSIPNFPASITTSRKVGQLLDRMLQGDFDPDGILYVDLLETIMSQVDITRPDFLRTGLYDGVFLTLQRLLRCDGVAVIEDPVCQIALEKISELVESASDWEKHDEQIETFIRNLAADACQACLLKVRLPVEQMSSDTQDWDTDERLKFQDFRYDVLDFLQSAFTILGFGLIEEIVNQILSQGPSIDWSTFEAATFSLTAFSDTMSSDPEVYDGIITTVLSSLPWTTLLQSGPVVPDRARQTGIRFITENEGYLQRHPNSLVVVLNFLFSSLHLQTSASAASRAIYSLCDSHRAILREGLPQFMESLATIGGLGEAERHRIYAAVAAIIHALPNEELKIEPLSRLIASVGRTLGALEEEGELERDELVRRCIDVMQTLAWIGKGLRSPHDVPVDLEAPSQDQGRKDFWTQGHGAQVQRSALNLYEATLKKMQVYVDNVFIEACCDFIKSGFTEEHPSPFKWPDLTALSLVCDLVHLENPAIDTILTCATSLLSSISPESLSTAVEKLVYLVCSGLQHVLSAYQQSRQLPDNNFASSSLDFLARLVSKWGTVWFTLQDSEGTAAVAFEIGLVLMAEADTLPRRSAALFFAAFADFTVPDALAAFDPGVTQRVGNVLHQFGARVLTLVLRLLAGECARSEIDSITEPLKKFIQKQLMLTKAVLREAVKPEAGILSEKAIKATTPEQRNRFLAQIESLRGGRKTNDIVKDFWIASRGSVFGYIA
ncbi:member of the karyopherin-beta [Exophiala dermatitidis]|uniref:Importin N-terminal domain-containing protein n=2 Tax=Exophiala dermatitidis TaxID=5970 RepID=H6BY92_EXODN|nr:uncharacterized protein HMPREF1120_04735 [Exophiala dermatitidis NIH/UT8656]KAJ4520277.1 member of the karyopherin-beta [Exophiala dermatitidis]EHY56660.1 hypothetical protein HMPREF1120_04735 [Exophiala dermatitidis NIH/UT8656]KAJ4524136.1 member of the karyopherin-beta [Exophiala dermatitidis]KAJ4525592.1 member of the karyopherin-beta [Exophiala dermatitidis]KAJ4536909.1 member of the karyopherin-beta [Exophiala dermatitidis]